MSLGGLGSSFFFSNFEVNCYFSWKVEEKGKKDVDEYFSNKFAILFWVVYIFMWLFRFMINFDYFLVFYIKY